MPTSEIKAYVRENVDGWEDWFAGGVRGDIDGEVLSSSGRGLCAES